jgi:hypothetical protein
MLKSRMIKTNQPPQNPGRFTAQLTTLFGMANLVLVKRRLFELDILSPS